MGLLLWPTLCLLLAGILLVNARPRRATLFGDETADQHDADDIFLKRTRRQSDGALSTKRETKYLLSVLNQLLKDLKLDICEGDIDKGIQCMEENLCVPWEGICDGTQVCGMDRKSECLNSSHASYGVPVERLCNGDENQEWCQLVQYIPSKCGSTVEVPAGGKATVYSPSFPLSYPGDVYCTWSIVAPAGVSLSVSVKSFETEENYDSMSIGPGLTEGEGKNSYYIYKHTGMALPSVPDFRTSDNELFLAFNSDMWVAYKGFEVEFADLILFDPNVDVTDISMDTNYNTTCGDTVTVKADMDAVILSPRYPRNYLNKYQCDWVVSVESGQRIGIAFETLDLEPDADILEIGRGSTPGSGKMMELTGNSRPEETILIESETVWLRLTTDASITRIGFKATVREQPYNECGGDVPIRRGGSAVVASPEFPDIGYHLNHNCIWKIEGDTERGLTAIFKDFSTEKQWDTVSMGFGTEPARDGSNYVIENWSGNKLPTPTNFTTTENSMWIHFKTDGTVIDRGWKIKIVDSNVIKSDNVVKPGKKVKPDRDCGGTVSFDPSLGKVVITSPDYPYEYRPILDCQWFVDLPYEEDVRINFEQFSTEEHRDVVSVGSGTNPDDKSSVLIDNHSGTEKPEEVVTSEKKLWVRFLTDFQTEFKGWKMDIVTIPTEDCGGFIRVPSNTSISIASPGYPNEYLGGQKCIFTLVGPNNRRLRVSVADFESEPWGAVLSIGEGCRQEDPGSSVIVDRHSGYSRPLFDAFIPRTSMVWIKWITDYGRQYKGWKVVVSDTGLVGDTPLDEEGNPLPCEPPGPTTQMAPTEKPTPGPTEASGSGFPEWYYDNSVPVEPSYTEPEVKEESSVDVISKEYSY